MLYSYGVVTSFIVSALEPRKKALILKHGVVSVLSSYLKNTILQTLLNKDVILKSLFEIRLEGLDSYEE